MDSAIARTMLRAVHVQTVHSAPSVSQLLDSTYIHSGGSRRGSRGSAEPPKFRKFTTCNHIRAHVHISAIPSGSFDYTVLEPPVEIAGSAADTYIHDCVCTGRGGGVKMLWQQLCSYHQNCMPCDELHGPNSFFPGSSQLPYRAGTFCKLRMLNCILCYYCLE